MSAFQGFSYGSLPTSVQNFFPQSQIAVCPLTGGFTTTQTGAAITAISPAAPAPIVVIATIPVQKTVACLITHTYTLPCYTSQSHPCRVIPRDNVIVVAITSDLQWAQLHGSNT